MKKIAFILCAIFVCASTSAFASVETKKFPLQFALTAKTPAYSLGNGEFFQAKGLVFHMRGFTQTWIYLSLKEANTTASVGSAINWRSQDIVFVGLKRNINFSKTVFTTHEFLLINHDQDFFYWGLLDRVFPAKGNPYIGLYWEVSNQAYTAWQIGPHIGTDHFELDLLFGEKESNVRFSFTVPVSF